MDSLLTLCRFGEAEADSARVLATRTLNLRGQTLRELGRYEEGEGP